MNGKRPGRVICLVLLILCLSCQSTIEEATAPEELIEQEEMVKILMDVYSIEARIASYGQNFDSSMVMFNLVEEDLLAKHGTTRTDYKSSMQYYFDNPDQLLQIYEAVVDSLSYRERKLTQESGRKDE